MINFSDYEFNYPEHRSNVGDQQSRAIPSYSWQALSKAALCALTLPSDVSTRTN